MLKLDLNLKFKQSVSNLHKKIRFFDRTLFLLFAFLLMIFNNALEILGSVIICFPFCDVKNFEINLSFLIKPFAFMTKRVWAEIQISSTRKEYEICNKKHIFFSFLKPSIEADKANFLEVESLTFRRQNYWRLLAFALKSALSILSYFLSIDIFILVNTCSRFNSLSFTKFTGKHLFWSLFFNEVDN